MFGQVLKGVAIGAMNWWIEKNQMKALRQRRSWYSGDNLTFTSYATCLGALLGLLGPEISLF